MLEVKPRPLRRHPDDSTGAVAKPDQHEPDQHEPDQHEPDQHEPDQHEPDRHGPERPDQSGG